MDLIQEFAKRRGIDPKVIAEVKAAEQAQNSPDAADIIRIAFDGKLRESYLIPVLPPYQSLFGPSIWLCADEDQAQQCQSEETLAFAPGELMDVVMMPVEKISGILAVKRSFSGMVTR